MAGDMLSWLHLQLDMAFQVKRYSDRLENELKHFAEHFILWELQLAFICQNNRPGDAVRRKKAAK